MSVADYFVKSVYIDAQGKERPCYEVTKLGCDFLANKFTGEKGVLFTARYVKRFHDMENAIQQKVYETWRSRIIRKGNGQAHGKAGYRTLEDM